eukprot:8939644-Pyramimonas_sp.AAC.1
MAHRSSARLSTAQPSARYIKIDVLSIATCHVPWHVPWRVPAGMPAGGAVFLPVGEQHPLWWR